MQSPIYRDGNCGAEITRFEYFLFRIHYQLHLIEHFLSLDKNREKKIVNWFLWPRTSDKCALVCFSMMCMHAFESIY